MKTFDRFRTCLCGLACAAGFCGCDEKPLTNLPRCGGTILSRGSKPKPEPEPVEPKVDEKPTTVELSITTSPEEDKKSGFISGGMFINRDRYTKREVERGKWAWAFDREATEAAEKRSADREKHRAELYWALRSRVLTDEEMAEVEKMGVSLTVRFYESYKHEEKARELNDALLHQFRLRAAASAASNPAPPHNPEP